MDDVDTVRLPGPAIAAAAAGETVWCAAGDRLLSYSATGEERFDTAAPEGLRSLGAGGDGIAATLDTGVIVWFDPETGETRKRASLAGEIDLVSGDQHMWAVDREAGRGWRLDGPGMTGRALALGPVDRAAAEGDRLWWTSREDTLLRGGDRQIDLGVEAAQRGGMAACAGSIWIGARGALVRVGAWAAELGRPIEAPGGPVPHLACSGGAIVGGPAESGLIVLDPSVDAGVRRVDVDVGGELAFLIATQDLVWAFPTGAAEARQVRIHPGSPGPASGGM